VLVPALLLLFRGALAGRMGIVLLSAIVAHQAWHWMIDRGAVLLQTPWPRPTWQGVLTLAQWVVAVIVAVAAVRLLPKWIGRKVYPRASQ
jgi:hypothetical protein